MSNYTLFPDDDKAQTSGSAITATSTNYNGGSAAALGVSTPSDSVLTDQNQLGNTSTIHGSQVVQGNDVFGAFQGAAVTADSVADDTNGFCDFADTGHSLVVGDVVSISGSTNGNVDGIHVVTSLPDGNSFVTNVPYVASATAGTYSLVAGNYATMTAESFILKAYSSSVAGGQYTAGGYGADYGIRRSIHKLEHLWTLRVATAIRAGYWNIFTGSWSTAPTNADDAATMGADHAATPTYAVPGELTYRVSGMPDATNGLTQDDYEAKTG